MKLVEFRIQNYRSVIDSGPVRVDQRVALLGRNESGKTNIMSALASLNPPEGISEMSFVRDFPRDREIDDYSSDLRVVDTVWALEASEQKELRTMFPRAKGVKEITVGRSYAPTRFVGIRDLKDLSVDSVSLDKHMVKLRRAMLRVARDKDDESMVRLTELALDRLSVVLEATQDPVEWAASAGNALSDFRRTMLNEGVDMPPAAEDALAALDEYQASVDGDHEAQMQAMNWLVEQLPVFVYMSDIPELDGRMDLAALAERVKDESLEPGDLDFMRLARVGGFDPVALVDREAEAHEHRQQLVNRAGGTVTRKFRKLWSDRPIKVRFNLDGDRFDILISDPTAVYDMEVNLNERSRGFRWFFSLYVLLAADTMLESKGRESILLLDEPGLHLHALGQKDLLEHLARGFRNQIIFATHSPFMVPVEELGTVRTVSFNEEEGTTCSNKPKGDARTLYPLQAAMAYASEDGLFGDQPVVMVPDLHDYLVLGAMSAHLIAKGKHGLPDDVALVPMGGLDRAVYMLATFSDDNIGLVLVVNDADLRWQQMGALLGPEDPVLLASEFAGMEETHACGLEDLLPAASYEKLVRSSYERSLGRKKLKLDPQVFGITQRCKQAFDEKGLLFQPARVASLLMRRVMEGAGDLIDDETEDRFEALFTRIDERLG